MALLMVCWWALWRGELWVNSWALCWEFCWIGTQALWSEHAKGLASASWTGQRRAVQTDGETVARTVVYWVVPWVYQTVCVLAGRWVVHSVFVQVESSAVSWVVQMAA